MEGVDPNIDLNASPAPATPAPAPAPVDPPVPAMGEGGSVDSGFKITKKHVIIALVIGFAVWLIIRYRRKGYIIAPKKVKEVEKQEVIDSFSKYDHGEVDFRSNGISVFNVDWKNKTFHYMAVADNESIQGKYEWDKPNDLRRGNFQGKTETSTGWVFHYGKKPQRGYEVVSLTLANPSKKTSFNKVVDFTTKRVG